MPPKTTTAAPAVAAPTTAAAKAKAAKKTPTATVFKDGSVSVLMTDLPLTLRRHVKNLSGDVTFLKSEQHHGGKTAKELLAIIKKTNPQVKAKEKILALYALFIKDLKKQIEDDPEVMRAATRRDRENDADEKSNEEGASSAGSTPSNSKNPKSNNSATTPPPPPENEEPDWTGDSCEVKEVEGAHDKFRIFHLEDMSPEDARAAIAAIVEFFLSSTGESELSNETTNRGTKLRDKLLAIVVKVRQEFVSRLAKEREVWEKAGEDPRECKIDLEAQGLQLLTEILPHYICTGNLEVGIVPGPGMLALIGLAYKYCDSPKRNQDIINAVAKTFNTPPSISLLLADIVIFVCNALDLTSTGHPGDAPEDRVAKILPPNTYDSARMLFLTKDIGAEIRNEIYYWLWIGAALVNMHMNSKNCQCSFNYNTMSGEEDYNEVVANLHAMAMAYLHRGTAMGIQFTAIIKGGNKIKKIQTTGASSRPFSSIEGKLAFLKAGGAKAGPLESITQEAIDKRAELMGIDLHGHKIRPVSDTKESVAITQGVKPTSATTTTSSKVVQNAASYSQNNASKNSNNKKAKKGGGGGSHKKNNTAVASTPSAAAKPVKQLDEAVYKEIVARWDAKIDALAPGAPGRNKLINQKFAEIRKKKREG